MADKLAPVSTCPVFLTPPPQAVNGPSTAAITSVSSTCEAKPTAIDETGEKAIKTVLQFLDNSHHGDRNEEAIKIYRELTEQLISQARQKSSLNLTEIKFKILKHIVTIKIFPDKDEQRSYYNQNCDKLFIQEAQIPDQIFNHSRRQTIIKEYSFKGNEQSKHDKITKNEFQQLKAMKQGHDKYDTLFLKYLNSISLQCDKFVDNNSDIESTSNNRVTSRSSSLHNKNQQHCLNNINETNRKAQRTQALKKGMESNNQNDKKPPLNGSVNNQNSVSENTGTSNNITSQSPLNINGGKPTSSAGNIETTGIKNKTINPGSGEIRFDEEALLISNNVHYGSHEGHKLDESKSRGHVFIDVSATTTQVNKALENNKPNENDSTPEHSAQYQKEQVVDVFSHATTSVAQSNKSEEVHDAHTKKILEHFFYQQSNNKRSGTQVDAYKNENINNIDRIPEFVTRIYQYLYNNLSFTKDMKFTADSMAEYVCIKLWGMYLDGKLNKNQIKVDNNTCIDDDFLKKQETFLGEKYNFRTVEQDFFKYISKNFKLKEAGTTLISKMPIDTKENVVQNISDNSSNENRAEESSDISVDQALVDRLSRGISKIDYREPPTDEQGAESAADNSTASSSEPRGDNVSLAGNAESMSENLDAEVMVKEQLQHELNELESLYLELTLTWKKLLAQKKERNNNFHINLFTNKNWRGVKDYCGKVENRRKEMQTDGHYLESLHLSLTDYTKTVKDIFETFNEFLLQIANKTDQQLDNKHYQEIMEERNKNNHFIKCLDFKSSMLSHIIVEKIAPDSNYSKPKYKKIKYYDMIGICNIFENDLAFDTDINIEGTSHIYDEYKRQKRSINKISIEEDSEYEQDDRRSLKFDETDSDSDSDSESSSEPEPSDRTYLNMPRTSVFTPRRRGQEVMMEHSAWQNRRHDRFHVDKRPRQLLTKRKH